MTGDLIRCIIIAIKYCSGEKIIEGAITAVFCGCRAAAVKTAVKLFLIRQYLLAGPIKAVMGTKVFVSDLREPLAGVKRYRVNIILLPELSVEREGDLASRFDRVLPLLRGRVS